MKNCTNFPFFTNGFQRDMAKSALRKNIFSTLLLLGAMLVSVGARGQTSYTSTSATGAWNTSRWNNTSDATPYTATFTDYNNVNFTSGSYLFGGMGTTINVGNITLASDVTVTFTANTGTVGTGGVKITFDVGSGATLDFSTQGFSTATGTGFIKSGSGVLALTGGNYTGGFTLSGGTVILRGTNALGAGGSLLIIGGTLAANANRNLSGKFPGGITIGGDFTLGSSIAPASNTALLIFSNAMDLGGNTSRTITLGNNANNTWQGVISGPNSSLVISATGTGTLQLIGTNTYNGGTTINSGTLLLGPSGNVLANAGAVNVNGGTLSCTTVNETIGALTLTSGSITGTTGTLTPSSTTASAGTISKIIGGSGTFTKNTSGIVTLSGVNTYSGGTTINDGVLVLGGTGTVLLDAGAVNVNGGTLNCVTYNETIGALTLTSGDITGYLGTLTPSSTTANEGLISIIIGGTGTFTKNTSGTVTLSGANTYSGGTTINGGVLQLGAADVLADAGQIILSGGALVTSGFSETVGTLQLTASSDISLGTGEHTLTFSNSSGVIWTAGQTLTITGWTGSAGKIMVGAGGLSTAQLAQVSFTGYAGTGAISNGELVPASSLPIKLISFNATRQNNQTQLTFSTATEENNSFFAIERSGNGTDFRTIGKVNGAGTTTSIQNYTFTDETPLSGINYYRLKQVDFDGQFSYSPVATVVFDNKAGIRLAPSPVQDQLRVELDEMFQGDAQWQLYDFAGRLVQTGVLSAENMVFNVEVGSLTPGNYVIRVVSGQTTLTKQFQK